MRQPSRLAIPSLTPAWTFPNIVARAGCGEDGVHGIVVNGHDADEVAAKAEVMPPSRIFRSGSMRSSSGEEIGRSVLSGRDLEW